MLSKDASTGLNHLKIQSDILGQSTKYRNNQYDQHLNKPPVIQE
jgi:hypothetical protein